MNKLDRNLEALSAYLDGELSAGERSRIEKQLATDQNLQNLYEQLRRTRTILQSTPLIRAPRSYLLTQSMVGEEEKMSRAFPILRFASAFAALLLVLLFIGDFFVLQRPVLAPSRAIQVAEVIQEEMEQPVAEGEFLESQPPAAAEPLMQLPQAEEGAPEAAAEENISSIGEATPMMDKVVPTQMPSSVDQPEQMLGAADEQGFDSDQVLKSLAPSEDLEAQSVINLRLVIRLAEYSLLIIAVSAGIAALIIFRRNR
jgi:hypothetical protein